MGRKSSKSTPIRPVSEPTPPSPLTTAVTASGSSSSAYFNSTFSGNVAAQNTATATFVSTHDDGSKSNSDYDTIPEPPRPNPNPKSKKSKLAEKRPVDDNQMANTTTKRVKKDSTSKKSTEIENEPNSVSVSGMAEKKLFQRLWTKEDEITLIKGLIDHKVENCVDPLTRVDEFLVLIKKSLQVPDVNKSQVVRKVRRLRKRFETLSSKKKISDAHDMKLLELSEMVWGDNNVAGDGKKVNLQVEKANRRGKKRPNVVEAEMGVAMEEGMVLGFDEESAAVLREALKRVEGEEREEIKTVVDRANAAYLTAFMMRQEVLKLVTKKLMNETQN